MNDSVKRNVRLVSIAFCAALTSFVTVSCSDNDDRVCVYRPVKYISMGVVDDEGKIQTDKGNILIPDGRSVEHELSAGERVFLNCHILEEENKNTFRVRVNNYYQLLTKDFIHSSETDEQTLGDNPVNVEQAWFGGGYLNMRIALKHNPSTNIPHSVNLVYDETESTADTARFVLYHNACGDTEKTVTGKAHASFKLEELLDNEQSKIYVVLKWRWYNHRGVIVEHEDGGYYESSTDKEVEENTDEGNVNIQ